MVATEVKGSVKVMSHGTCDGVKFLMVGLEDGYSSFKKLPAALEFDGSTYGKTGWNSDRMIAYYRDDALIARSK